MRAAQKDSISGDLGFIGANLREDPALLAAGLLADAENLRFHEGVAETRRGVVKLPWSNRLDAMADTTISPFGVMYGAGRFRDPESRDWMIIAADGGVVRCHENNFAESLSLPAGVKILGPVKIRQAFNKVYLARGRFLAPLRMADLETGFVDVVQRWAAASVYAPADEVAYGPFQAVTSLTSVGAVATCVTTNPHGYITGSDVVMSGANEAEYNGRVNVTVTDPYTFTYQFVTAGTVMATGTIKVSNMALYWSALGSKVTLSGITHATVTATATCVGHGFVNGDSVTVSGATAAAYNGTFVISGVTANTFVYTMLADPGADASVAGTARNNTRVVAGRSPDTNGNDWQQIYNILPNIEDALYVNNRLLCITAYTPGSATYDGNSSYTKADFIVATDYLDETHFDFANEFRINQGSDDELVELVKFGDSTVLAFKQRSWGVLANVGLDLSQLTLDMRGTEYGLSGNGATVTAGDTYFMAERRGVVSIRQTEQGKVQSVDLPLSQAIAPLVKRINWSYKGKIRMAYWDNKLYVAVPLDDAVSRKYLPMASDIYDASGQAAFPGVMQLQRYFWSQGNAGGAINAATTETTLVPLIISIPEAPPPAPHRVTLTVYGGTPGLHATVKLWEETANVNNTILVYDFLTEQWTPRDTGSALTVKEFFKGPYNGVERLFFISEDGFVNLMEEGDAGDEVYDVTSPTKMRWEDMVSRWRTRGYSPDRRLVTDRLVSEARMEQVTVCLATWNAKYSARLIFDGANEEQQMSADGETIFEKDRTKYYRPFDAEDYDVTNVAGDHAVAYRQDYSVALGVDGLFVTGGVQLDLMQETFENFAVHAQEGRSVQAEMTCYRGRMALKAVELDGERVRQRKGVHA